MIVPSYIAKVARAKKHLIDLKTAIDEFAGAHPYTVSERTEGKKKRNVHRLTFTADPVNTDIPIIAADAIYNLRSSLDHLMSSLVPRNQRSSAMFPVYFEASGNPPGQGRTSSDERTALAGSPIRRHSASLRSQSSRVCNLRMAVGRTGSTSCVSSIACPTATNTRSSRSSRRDSASRSSPTSCRMALNTGRWGAGSTPHSRTMQTSGTSPMAHWTCRSREPRW